VPHFNGGCKRVTCFIRIHERGFHIYTVVLYGTQHIQQKWFLLTGIRGAVCISVAFIQGTPPGYFTHVSITTPIVSALKNYYR
jgi:hypothetical protein